MSGIQAGGGRGGRWERVRWGDGPPQARDLGDISIHGASAAAIPPGQTTDRAYGLPPRRSHSTSVMGSRDASRADGR